MGSLSWFVFVYVLGGLTFIPLCLAGICALIWYTSPEITEKSTSESLQHPSALVHDGHPNERLVLKTGTDDLAEKFHRRHDSDVAAGYFAICREYVPGGVKGKPFEKPTSAGGNVVNESPSVYQSMYRSIFDRSQKPTIEASHDPSGRNAKKTNNVFYVVLRHGHLMLYDDIQQLEVRYVISLEHHDVDIFGGDSEPSIPEAELFIKRNSIRLRRKQGQVAGEDSLKTSLPFYFFSENCSEKEDFYHAILKNQEKNIVDPPIPQEFETGHIISLVQNLHSSEEQLQTRWLNALVGRWFLAVYKTPFLEQTLRQKLTKKISRVKKPNFITKLALQKIDLGEGAPLVTNPRLKDLTVNGDCTVEADINYAGSFRIEIAATARIDLGKRLGAREVDMVLAATCRKLTGHILLRMKPPPSNRLWFAFEKMPKIDMVLEPVVSSRQITYTVILRAMESRIREVLAEAIVLPFWDDIPFLNTEKETFRGGIWAKDHLPQKTVIKDEVADDESLAANKDTNSITTMQRDDRVMSTPVLSDSSDTAALTAAKRSMTSLKDALVSNGQELRSRKPPRALRSSSFASVADPTVSPTSADGNLPARTAGPASTKDSMGVLKSLSSRSLGTSPNETESPLTDTVTEIRAEVPKIFGDGPQIAHFDASSRDMSQNSTEENDARTGELISVEDNLTKVHEADRHDRPLGLSDRKQALSSINAAASAAQKWSWGVLTRNKQKEMGKGTENDTVSASPKTPMGRGRPLPPPGQPLPPPERPSIFGMNKNSRTASPRGNGKIILGHDTDVSLAADKDAPALPERPTRRRRQASLANTSQESQPDDVFVVEAPSESDQGTPIDEHHDEFFGHKEDGPGLATPTIVKQEVAREDDNDDGRGGEGGRGKMNTPFISHENDGSSGDGIESDQQSYPLQ